MSALHLGPAPALIHVVPRVFCQLEALAQERQQLVCGSEPQLAPRVDFLDPSGDTAFCRVGVGVELEDKRRSQHMNDVTAPAAVRCESRVQLCVKVACEPFWRRLERAGRLSSSATERESSTEIERLLHSPTVFQHRIFLVARADYPRDCPHAARAVTAVSLQRPM